ncbi:MAG TPA: hypothetical protein PLP42_22950, partial [Acidobacteriota bacterium]|nr:hypothetical protein [Acidobacteriota bacterium]
LGKIVGQKLGNFKWPVTEIQRLPVPELVPLKNAVLQALVLSLWCVAGWITCRQSTGTGA